ncbi:proline dehydrogenase family protein [Taibaiella chishuiensis]|uniref:L-proline dehydrogenase n=1 Tax=Taibaiella chishuiensis TaxID=1434707 RepID=A0A2P8DAR2_9BACT|nr:proline dehydrogenase family protein [Taibaiella chishuiensis]PSK94295.1 L-proline dehydrogenase [Taibaiella chishuiensis]
MALSFDNTEIAFRYRDNKELKRAHFLFSSMSSPFLSKTGMKFTQLAMSWGLPVKGMIKKTIFSQFCGGETIEEAAGTAAVLGKYNVGVALDYSVEGKDEEAEFDHAVPEFIKAIEYAATQKNIPFIPIKITGFARFALLEKVHAQTPLSEAEQAEWKRVEQRIDKICGTAARCRIMILVDAEESWIQQPVDDLSDTMMDKYNRNAIVVFNTFQMYRHDRLAFLKQSHQLALEKGYILGAKIVRGAYMEKERKRAAEMGYPSPIQPDKASTDRDYDSAAAYCIDHLDTIALFIGTHNEDSCFKAAALMQQKGIAPQNDHLYFSQLFGMSDNITFNLADAGFHVSKYLPYGPVKDVIPYLMRRAQENTSVAGQTGRELGLIKKEMKRRGL